MECPLRRRRSGFTLVELLVVIGIIAVLISLLLPAINRVRMQSLTLKCSSQLRQVGMAMSMYAGEHQSRLPAIADSTNNLAWYQVIAPYMGSHSKDRSTFRFGYNGTDTTLGDRFMPCPAREPDAKFDQTYGVNYANVISFYLVGPNYPPAVWDPIFNNSAKLSKVPAYVFLVADGKSRYGYGRTEILNPDMSGSWSLSYDSDKDGVLDTALGELFTGAGQYNGFYPAHQNRSGNFLFADGSVRLVNVKSWARNEGRMWGKGRPYDAYK